MTKMIPPAPTSAVMMPTPKQKIGFSIESIVGNDAAPSTNSIHTSTHLHHNLHQTQMSPKNETTQIHHHHHHNQQSSPPQTRPQDIQDIINRLQNTANNLVNNNNNNNNNSNLIGSYSPPLHHTRLSPDATSVLHLKRERSPQLSGNLTPPLSLSNTPNLNNHNNNSHGGINHSPSSSPNNLHHKDNQSSPPPSSQCPPSIPSSTPSSINQSHFGMKGPIVVPGMPPGLIRPFPTVAGPPSQNSQSSQPDIKALPPYISSPDMVPQHHNPHLLAAAQFQMAAALQAGHVLGPAAAASAAAAAGLPHHSPFLQNHPAMARDSYPLYPWLLSRHGRIFPHRFPGNFLLQPFRKPKRIRTAFSPSQLLKLEHAFENNQYVVGAERKALAQSLNLSETQVKVWFQNRRTKHKRMQQEDEKGGGNNNNSSDRLTSCDDSDDELIDMEMDDCPSDDELDASH